ncbi:type I restriction endonuclease subunit R [Polynucleobacter sp. 30F-ANTBAC]|uniref:type I restriction endonuclease subunit R n=1 Tax=Polynucleobacter sp. 30F-ANTBAC TaxID=2689095 RepID=UPI001C0D5FAA|nr:type I restriction endonuclease [Polynucleobacter sp. 30F-ANTBAC]MBU3600388.1 type I restriction endonuclease subunit R [Polynucleobacter sp. 30F-ANTBAC]
MIKKTIAKVKLHTEEAFEQHFVEQLITNQGYIERANSDYRPDLALDSQLLVNFVKQTQPESWALMESKFGSKVEEMFCKEVDKKLKSSDIVTVLREGIQFTWGAVIKLCYFKPASNINPNLEKLYEANLLSVIRQVYYSVKDRGEKGKNNSIDVVLFLNGIPVATVELKNALTGQTIQDAIRQYKYDRKPAGETLLASGRVLVHVAVDTDEAGMTTKLNNGKTVFLPLNRGNDGRSGNGAIKDEFKTAYLYKDLGDQKAIFSRDVLLDIIGNLAQKDGDVLIFPRFHQIDAVRKLLADAKEKSSGQKYLIQHSPGSGKTWTISWVAAGLAKLHNKEDKNIFDSVVIISDRRVLDGQLQKAIRKLGISNAYIETVDKTSAQLREALEGGKKIIVTTIQKFSTETISAMNAMTGKRFAVIIDEAHSSQSGKSAQGVQEALGDQSDVEALGDEIAKAQASKQKRDNISYLAFTATPKNTTLEIFGTRESVDAIPHPFHEYSMRQAVEEGFILDVLQNYRTYKSYYELEKTIEDDPRFKGAKAKRKVARYVSLTTINQKAAVIVEHFNKHVKNELNDQAKAMVVCQSREHAFRHYEAIKGYIIDHKDECKGLDAIIAFSGDLFVDGQTYTEPGLNGFSEKDLPEQFDTNLYQILVVANKYQTGFDQPKICAMYIDRKLDGLQCVQTLTRANRTFPGKTAESIYILDFQNTIEDIKEAFKVYFDITELEGLTDPEQIYELKSLIMESGFVDQESVDDFAQILSKPEVTTGDRATLEGIVNQAVNSYNVADIPSQDEFRQAIKSYCRFYSFIIQVYPVADVKLESLYWYATWLGKKLKNNKTDDGSELTDEMIRLTKLRIEESEKGSATPYAGSSKSLPPISAFGVNTKPTENDEKELSEIIKEFNDKHGTEFTEDDIIRIGIQAEKVANEMSAVIKINPVDVSLDTFADRLFDRMAEVRESEKDLDNIMTSDQDSWRRLASLLLRANKVRLETGLGL